MFTVMITFRKSNKNLLERQTGTYHSIRGKTPCTYFSECIKVKKNVNFSLSLPLRCVVGIKLQLHVFLTLALDGGDWVIGCFKCRVFLGNCSKQMKNKNYKAHVYVSFSILSLFLVQLQAAGFRSGCVSNPNYSYYHTEYCDTIYWRNKLRNVYCDISWSLADCLMKQMCLLSVNDHHTCDVHLIHFTICHLCATCCWKSSVPFRIAQQLSADGHMYMKQFYFKC